MRSSGSGTYNTHHAYYVVSEVASEIMPALWLQCFMDFRLKVMGEKVRVIEMD